MHVFSLLSIGFLVMASINLYSIIYIYVNSNSTEGETSPPPPFWLSGFNGYISLVMQIRIFVSNNDGLNLNHINTQNASED